MWQIITHNLSVMLTQGWFLATQIAAEDLVTGRMTFAKVWVMSPAPQAALFMQHKHSFVHQNVVEMLSRRIVARFHTKGSRLVIMMSRYHSFTRAFANPFLDAQTNTVDDCIHSKQTDFWLHLPSFPLWQNNCFKIPLRNRTWLYQS